MRPKVFYGKVVAWTCKGGTKSYSLAHTVLVLFYFLCSWLDNTIRLTGHSLIWTQSLIWPVLGIYWHRATQITENPLYWHAGKEISSSWVIHAFSESPTYLCKVSTLWDDVWSMTICAWEDRWVKVCREDSRRQSLCIQTIHFAMLWKPVFTHLAWQCVVVGLTSAAHPQHSWHTARSHPYRRHTLSRISHQIAEAHSSWLVMHSATSTLRQHWQKMEERRKESGDTTKESRQSSFLQWERYSRHAA